MFLTALFLAGVIDGAAIRHPFLSPIFSDHMVLQRGRPNVFWGWTQSGKQVKVRIAGHSGTGIAASDGKWVVKVDPPKVGGPYTVDVAGPEHVTLNDVLVGDVWVCGGQSNMQFGVKGTLNGDEEIAKADHPQIRFTIVPTKMSFAPRDYVVAPWQVCTPKTIGNDAWNGLSAVGYFFGRELQKNLNVPIGLVHDNRGGSSAESWISRPTVEAEGDFAPVLAQMDDADRTGHPGYARSVQTWLGRAAKTVADSAWTKPDSNVSSYQPVTLPGSYTDFGFGWQQGVVTFIDDVTLPSGIQPGDATLSLGVVDGLDAVWVNGTQVGSGFGAQSVRQYTVPSTVLVPGRNRIAVRVVNGGASDGFMSPADKLELRLSGGNRIPLSGSHWRASVGPSVWSAGDFPWGMEGSTNTPTIHYNAMISPVAPLAVRGVIWYQGETNCGRSRQYVGLMERVASDWRKAFGTNDLPFLQVQLANFMARATEPGDSSWAALREAQAISASKIPGGGLATAVDIGEASDIHPKDKLDVGLRLAHVALKQVYGKRDILAYGPTYRSLKKDGQTLVVSFDNCGAGLAVHGSELRGFAVAGSDRKFHWAKATIVGNTVVLTCPDVADPVAARYAWADNPETPLFNKANLPAFPFRTDDWPVN